MSGDDEFTAFAALAGPRLRRVAYLMCRDWHLAQDLTQTALARMYAKWSRVRRSDNPDAYSRRILMNVVFDHRRRTGEISVAELPDRAVADGGGHGPELRLTLMEALATLNDRDRAILVLRHFEDRGVDEVATILDVSVSVVKMQNARSLTRLRALLGEDFVLS